LYSALALAGGVVVGIVAALIGLITNPAGGLIGVPSWLFFYVVAFGLLGAIVGALVGLIQRRVGGPSHPIRVRTPLLWALVAPAAWAVFLLFVVLFGGLA
jgi:hypothetical protein